MTIFKSNLMEYFVGIYCTKLSCKFLFSLYFPIFLRHFFFFFTLAHKISIQKFVWFFSGNVDVCKRQFDVSIIYSRWIYIQCLTIFQRHSESKSKFKKTHGWTVSRPAWIVNLIAKERKIHEHLLCPICTC